MILTPHDHQVAVGHLHHLRISAGMPQRRLLRHLTGTGVELQKISLKRLRQIPAFIPPSYVQLAVQLRARHVSTCGGHLPNNFPLRGIPIVRFDGVQGHAAGAGTSRDIDDVINDSGAEIRPRGVHFRFGFRQPATDLQVEQHHAGFRLLGVLTVVVLVPANHNYVRAVQHGSELRALLRHIFD